MNAVEEALELIVPEAGLHRGIPAEVYHSWPLASAGALKDIDRSPRHMKYARENPCEPTPAMALGSAVHVAVLEPDDFGKRYFVEPKCDKRTKEGKATFLAFAESLPDGAKIIDADDFARCCAIRDSVWAHPAARALLEARTETEVSAVWKCRKTGVGCKCRADAVSQGVIADVKTCEDASREAFERSIFNFKYHFQAAHYIRGMSHYADVDGFVFIAVEKQPPHAVAVYRLDDEVIAAADEELMKLLELYGKCERERTYPAYPEEVQSIRIPAWAMARMNGNGN